MHGPMLDVLAEALGVQPRIENTVWESLALANAMTAMATSRRFAWHSIGALGIIEQTAPGRSVEVAAGLRRIGPSGRERHYSYLHAAPAVQPSAAANRATIAPRVAPDGRSDERRGGKECARTW